MAMDFPRPPARSEARRAADAFLLSVGSGGPGCRDERGVREGDASWAGGHSPRFESASGGGQAWPRGPEEQRHTVPVEPNWLVLVARPHPESPGGCRVVSARKGGPAGDEQGL